MSVTAELSGERTAYRRPEDAGVIRTIGSRPEEYAGGVYRNCHIVRYDGAEYVFSHRAILTMVVMSACNAACMFCSNEITFTPSGPYLRHDARLERIKDFALLAGVSKVAYTGGEPTLHPQKLYDLVSTVNPGFSRARLHTNGFGLFKEVEAGGRRQSLLSALIGAGLSGVSVSVAHHDQETNRAVMRFKPAASAWAGMGEEELRAVAQHASEHFNPRLSCVMTEDGVRTVPDMLAFLEWGRSLGFGKFIFRTCSSIPEEFRKPTDYAGYNADNYMAIEDIAAELERRGGFELVYRQRKSDSKVDVYRWRGLTFDVDESGEEVDPDPKIRRINVMANGVGYTSWIDPMAVLFPDDLPRAAEARAKEFKLAAVGPAAF